MLPGYSSKANIFTFAGIGVLALSGPIAKNPSGGFDPVVAAIMVSVGLIVLIWGCVNFMRSKGYSGWFGLFGLLLLPGLIILAFFPDKHRTTSP